MKDKKYIINKLAQKAKKAGTSIDIDIIMNDQTVTIETLKNIEIGINSLIFAKKIINLYKRGKNEK
jgi:hypothetical protein